MKIPPNFVLITLLSTSACVFLCWILIVVRNDRKLMRYLKSDYPDRWSKVSATIDDVVSDTSEGSFIPGLGRASRHLHYIFSSENKENQVIVNLKRKIRIGFYATGAAIILLVSEFAILALLIAKKII